MPRSILHSILSRALGLGLFIVFLILLNILAVAIPIPVLVLITQFLNANLYLVVLMTIFSFFADVFAALEFPLNLPTPLFSAVGAMFIIAFILNIFGLVSPLTGGAISLNLGPYEILIYLIVFIIVFVLGYISIFSDLAESSDERPARHRSRR